MPSETLQDATRALSDVGTAAWLGGATFGKFALNPSLRAASVAAERGKVANAAWNSYNVVNALGLGVATMGYVAARTTALRPENLSDREATLARIQDVFVAASVVTGVANGIQGGRLAKQAPGGAVPITDGTKPALETPPEAAKIQRSLDRLGNVNILAGVGLVASRALLDRAAFSRAPLKRAPGVPTVTPIRIVATILGAMAGNAVYETVNSGDEPKDSVARGGLGAGAVAARAAVKAVKAKVS